MTTETTVRIYIHGQHGHVEIVASTAKKALDELEKLNLDGGLAALKLTVPYDGPGIQTEPVAATKTEAPTKSDSETPVEAEERTVAEETAPEPEFTEADVRSKVVELVGLPNGPAASIKIFTELEAFDENKNPKLSGLAPEKYGKAIELLDAKIAEAKKADAGGVL